MSKAVLVMDMPENCEHCRSRYIFGECGILHRYIDEDVDKPDWCPLVPMPDEKKSDPVMDCDIDFGIAEGWNNCIDAISGGKT